MTENIYMLIGRRIKEERQKRGLTQEELAVKAHIGTKFIGNIERGVSKPSLDTFIKIAKALNISCDLLISEDKNKKKRYKKPVSKHLEYLVSEFPGDEQNQLVKVIKDIRKLTLKK
ncbi:MAG: helix-turn-helix transcriptional regulator [Endomicrobiaceae bacterium]